MEVSPMSAVTTKDFGPLQESYAFFLDHATEEAEDARAYAEQVQSLAAGTELIRMLDFGCGAGRFTVQFLARSRLAPERLELSLVEPVDVVRQQAVQRLQSASAHPVCAWSQLPRDLDSRFDLVLANHVFYYVPNLDEVVESILRSLAPKGQFLAAIAGHSNVFIQFWNQCFALIGKPLPYNTAADFEEALRGQGISYSKQQVEYNLNFPDSEENRLAIMHFLLGHYLLEVPRGALLELFDPHAAEGRIAMRIRHDHFTAGHP
jgi:SAM-dependent methyltransferase